MCFGGSNMLDWTKPVLDTLTKEIDPRYRELLRLMLYSGMDGHSAVPIGKILDLAESYQEDFLEDNPIDVSSLRDIVSSLTPESVESCLAPYLTWENGCLVWHIEGEKEKRLAVCLKNLLSSEVPEAVDPLHLSSLTEEQNQALNLMRTSPLVVLTGGPGTGKSHVIAKFLEKLPKEELRNTAVAAPTGRAASRINEQLQGLPVKARTLHSLLQLYPAYGAQPFFKMPVNHLPYTTVIVDETSMVDVDLFLHLLEALGPGTRLILVGDEQQLPSVQNGAVLRDLVHYLESDPRLMDRHLARLTENHRLSRVSSSSVRALGKLFEEVRNFVTGQMPNFQGIDHRENFQLEDLLQAVVPLWKAKIQELPQTAGDLDDWLKSDIILLPLRHHPEWGVYAVQSALKKQLGFKTDKAVGMPILVTSNQPAFGLANGDRGQLRLVQNQWVVAFPGGNDNIRLIPLSQIQEYEDGFALTVHKSQGSEFERVVLALTKESSSLMSKELFYTAITRTKSHLTLFADSQSLEKCLHQKTVRHTLLSWRLSS